MRDERNTDPQDTSLSIRDIVERHRLGESSWEKTAEKRRYFDSEVYKRPVVIQESGSLRIDNESVSKRTVKIDNVDVTTYTAYIPIRGAPSHYFVVVLYEGRPDFLNLNAETAYSCAKAIVDIEYGDLSDEENQLVKPWFGYSSVELERSFVCESPIIYILDHDGFRAVDPDGLPVFHTMKSRDGERPVDLFGEEYFYEDLDYTQGCECVVHRLEDAEAFRLVYRKFKSYVETKNDCRSLFVKKSLGMRARCFPINVEWLMRQQDFSGFMNLEEWRQDTEIRCSLFSKAKLAQKGFDRNKAARAIRWLDLLSEGGRFHLYAKGASRPVNVTLYKDVKENQ